MCDCVYNKFNPTAIRRHAAAAAAAADALMKTVTTEDGNDGNDNDAPDDCAWKNAAIVIDILHLQVTPDSNSRSLGNKSRSFSRLVFWYD